MECPRCGARLSDRSDHCVLCGRPIDDGPGMVSAFLGAVREELVPDGDDALVEWRQHLIRSPLTLDHASPLVFSGAIGAAATVLAVPAWTIARPLIDAAVSDPRKIALLWDVPFLIAAAVMLISGVVATLAFVGTFRLLSWIAFVCLSRLRSKP